MVTTLYLVSLAALLDGAEKLGDYTKFDSESGVRTTTNDWKYGHT